MGWPLWCGKHQQLWNYGRGSDPKNHQNFSNYYFSGRSYLGMPDALSFEDGLESVSVNCQLMAHALIVS